MEEITSAEEWLQLLERANVEDIPSILDLAPESVQQLRGAWEVPGFSIMLKCASAVSFLEGVLAGHPTLLGEG